MGLVLAQRNNLPNVVLPIVPTTVLGLLGQFVPLLVAKDRSAVLVNVSTVLPVLIVLEMNLRP